MIALIGASGGIGRELAPSLRQLDSIIATYNTSPLDLRIEGLHEVKLDLTSEEQINQFGDSLSSINQKITLVNMAAVSIDSLLVNAEYADWKKVFEINVHSFFLLLKKILPKMIEDQWGRVILASSVVAEAGPVGTAAYSSSKSALRGLCKTVAHEYGRFNITCNLLEIGYFSKGLIQTVDEKKQQDILQRIPSKKFGEPHNIFHAVDFIMKADYLNGAVIRLDGGLQ